MANLDAARWRAVSAEIDQILDLPLEAREAALEALRARDAALAADVARLLAEQPAVEAGRFLEGGAASALPTATSASLEGLSVPPRPGPLPPMSEFGGYRVGRVLGRGGMGIVYEAEETESGRRVALKVLQRRPDDEYDRERFEREGRLAASIDHEHCVYVFAAEEIAGAPAIAMELMHGTLADRLSTDGPLSPTAAVDAALQLVAGLRAAGAAGILHRDVKPSNCFVDADGVVKIGDFGISRSTRPTDQTTRSTRGRIAATPSYASPEQLSGKALDVRADIYSLGTTIYELLTGERPFTRPDLMALLMAVANEPPRPPHAITPAVPKGLSQIVLRCLAKQPEDRFQCYDALAAALEPYASWSPTPATLGRRLAAGTIDTLVIGLASMPATAPLMTSFTTGHDPRVWLAHAAWVTALSLAYYTIFEGRWGAAPGKFVVGLAVVDAHAQPPSGRIAATRAACFLAPGLLWALFEALSPRFADLLAVPSRWTAIYAASEAVAVLALLFSTARRRNGYAGLHDLASGTRVVTRAARTAAPSARTIVGSSSAGIHRGTAGDGPRRGGFVVVPGSMEGLSGWCPGFDPRLRRPVWIRDLPAGTPPVPSWRARLARPTRLRWLAGRRSEREAWDVYESVSGMPLRRALDVEPDWPVTRRWLADLAHELTAQAPADQPPLEVDRVWVLDSGRVKLLDDPTEDTPRPEAPGAAWFLADVMRRLRTRASAPWPLSAERLLTEAPASPLPALAARLDALLQIRPAMTPVRRLGTMAAVSAAALMMTAGMLATMVALTLKWRSLAPDSRVTMVAVRTLRDDAGANRRGTPADHRDRLTTSDRNAIEIFLASRHRATLGDTRLFGWEYVNGATSEDRAIVARLLHRQPDSAVAIDAATGHPRVREIVRRAVAATSPPPILWRFAIYGMLLLTGLCSLVLAAACRGVAFRLFGYDVVTADGTPASRLRLLARSAIAWSPLFAAMAVARLALLLGVRGYGDVIMTVAVLLLFAGAVAAVWKPGRGIQDRLAGTWLVPR